MKKIIAIALFCFSSVVFAEHYAFGEVRTTISAYSDTSEKDHYEEFYGFYSYGIQESFGAFVFGQMNTDSDEEAYKQVYAGPYFRPTPWLEVGLGYGVEHFDGEETSVSGERFGSYVDVSGDRGSASLVFENGDSGYYYEARVALRITDLIQGGAIAMREVGYGPRLEVSFPLTPDTKLILWGAYLVGDEGKGEPKSSTMFNAQFEYGG